jgi:hypothetical protein
MASLNITVVPVEKADVPLTAGFLASAKLPLTINRLLWQDWPNHKDQLAQYRQAVEGAFGDPSVQSLKAVDNESGEIVGHLVLSRIEADKAKLPESKDEEKRKFPAGINPEVSLAVSKAVKEADETQGVEHFGKTALLQRDES